MAKKKKQLTVQDTIINWHTIDQGDYISLTDMANWDNDPNANVRIRNWLKRGNTVLFMEAWEHMHNPNFKYDQMVVLKAQLLQESYVLSPKRWIEATGAIGIFVKMGRYGGVFGHIDIALEFGSWLDPVFKLYLIKEFQRLKGEEANRKNLEWNANRFLTKRNYALQTEAIKRNLLPLSTEPPEREWLEYAGEADILNMALFGMTAKVWREKHPQEAKKGENIRDHATNIQLIVLSNLEALNAEWIRETLTKEERYERLKQAAVFQLGIFYRDRHLIE